MGERHSLVREKPADILRKQKKILFRVKMDFDKMS